LDEAAGARHDQEMDAAIELAERARQEVELGVLPTCQWAVALDGRVVEGETVGGSASGTAPRYLIYSCTKPVVASAVLQLLSEGAVRLDQRVAELIPEFATNGKDAVTVEQVLLHTGGFPSAPLGPQAWASRRGRLDRFADWRLNWGPGTRFEYHATSAHWVLVELLERVDGVDFRDAVRRRVIEPLGLTRLQLGVPVEEQQDIVRPVQVGEPPTKAELEALLGIPDLDLGEVTDDALLGMARPEALAVGVPGGGAVSTADDLCLFYQGLLMNPRELWDPAVLADATGRVRNRHVDPMTGIPANRTLAVVVAGDDGLAPGRGFGHVTGPRAFGHSGAGGQIAWADPDTGLSFAFLSNGLDRNLVRQAKRIVSLSNRASRLGAALRAETR
jgi:CubicO group peptidase (beta-lactamase class C family)